MRADVPVPPETVLFGEASLAGEVRQVSRADARLKEAAKLGFKRAIVPAGLTAGDYGLKLTSIRQLKDLVPLFAADAPTSRTATV